MSIGDHLRARREAGDFDTQVEIIEALDHGRLLENKVIVPLVIAEVQKYAKLGATALFLDGFPRRIDQAQEFETLVCMNPTCIDALTNVHLASKV